MSPKFINGSFAALFDNVDIVADYARHISRSRADDLNGCPIRLSPRRRLDDRPRQYSLDHSFPLQPASMAVTRQRAIFRPEVRQGSLDSKIEEIFQAPADQGCLGSRIKEIFQAPALLPRSKRSSKHRYEGCLDSRI